MIMRILRIKHLTQRTQLTSVYLRSLPILIHLNASLRNLEVDRWPALTNEQDSSRTKNAYTTNITVYKWIAAVHSIQNYHQFFYELFVLIEKFFISFLLILSQCTFKSNVIDIEMFWKKPI